MCDDKLCVLYEMIGMNVAWWLCLYLVKLVYVYGIRFCYDSTNTIHSES